jgi:hypothetical protein
MLLLLESVKQQRMISIIGKNQLEYWFFVFVIILGKRDKRRNNMNMVIRTYMEKCLEPENGKWGGRVLSGEYELKSTVIYRNMGGYKSIEEFKRNKEGNEIRPNVFKFSLGSQWGIKSYQEISFEEDYIKTDNKE